MFRVFKTRLRSPLLVALDVLILNIYFATSLILFPMKSVAQTGVRRDDITVDANGKPVGFAALRVCKEPTTATLPCAPLANIYSDQNLATSIANPTQADILGNSFFFAAPGFYHLEFSAAGLTPRVLSYVLLPTVVSNPISSTIIPSGPVGAVQVAGTPGNLSNDDANLHQDVTNHVFGVGTNSFTNLNSYFRGYVKGGLLINSEPSPIDGGAFAPFGVGEHGLEIAAGGGQFGYGPRLSLRQQFNGAQAAICSIGFFQSLNSSTADFEIQSCTAHSSVPTPNSFRIHTAGGVDAISIATNGDVSFANAIDPAIVPKAANLFHAGPTNGAAAAPTWRVIVPADVPVINLAAAGNGGVTGLLPNSNLLHSTVTVTAAAPLKVNGTTTQTAALGDTIPLTCPTCNTSSQVVQAVKKVGGCTTGSSSYDNCTDVLTWPVAFADTSYSVTCSGVGPTGIDNGSRANLLIASYNAATVTTQTITEGTQAESFTEIHCIGVRP